MTLTHASRTRRPRVAVVIAGVAGLVHAGITGLGLLFVLAFNDAPVRSAADAAGRTAFFLGLFLVGATMLAGALCAFTTGRGWLLVVGCLASLVLSAGIAVTMAHQAGDLLLLAPFTVLPLLTLTTLAIGRRGARA